TLSPKCVSKETLGQTRSIKRATYTTRRHLEKAA
ncbi:unnamed protein product, partial [marine sediment metagenome]